MLKKLAVKRDPETPPGQPGKMYLDCPCGEQIPLPIYPDRALLTFCPSCHTVYDGAGWIVLPLSSALRPETVSLARAIRDNQADNQ